MARSSAGVLLYRRGEHGLEVLLVHPGGPFWRARDVGAWSIPKGELEGEEAPDAAARREFAEELGVPLAGDLRALTPVRQKGGKLVHAFAVEGDLDVDAVRSALFEMEWPPKSGRVQSFPEVDRAAWLAVPLAREKIIAGQRPLLDELAALLGGEE